MDELRGFFAYPSFPPDLNETIENCISSINGSGIISIKSWKELSITGNYIIDTILETIDNSHIFICDLTYLNFNVLFELGYAIAKKKKIWIVLNPNIETSTRNYEKLKILTTIGYCGYENSNDLIKSFYSEQPHNNLTNLIFKDSLDENSDAGRKLLYLKSSSESDASVKLSVLIKESVVPSIVDDPSEVRIQPLNWYLKTLSEAYGVIVHLIADNVKNSQIINAKSSFVSGLAYGLGVPLAIIAPDPFDTPPMDYRDILIIHKTAKECEKFGKEWLKNIEETYTNRKEKYNSHVKDKKTLNELHNIFIGEPIAEHESEYLIDYFVETSQFLEALQSRQSLFIGRKGTGKTANLFKLTNEIRKDKRNFICKINPVGHEIDGVLNILKKNDQKSEKGYLVESIWKYLIYSEFAKSVYENIKSKPGHIYLSEEEVELVTFIDNNEKIINADFTLRLENVVNSLKDVQDYKSIESNRLKISELLHQNIIPNLRRLLGSVLKNKNKVCILIDNLDSSWNNRNDVQDLCELLFGLLRVISEIIEDFLKEDYRYKKVNLSIVCFLRSDIFNQILTYANERDKIQHTKLAWQDMRLLFRVIEDRIKYSVDSITSPQDLWSNYFCPYIDGIPIKEYIENLIIPRPRDIIILFKAAIQEAIDREHLIVKEEDFRSAEFKYSLYVLESLLAEKDNRIDDLESLLYEFAGSSSLVTIEEVEENIFKFNHNNPREVIDLLCELTFLGLETETDKFEFISEQKNKKILYRLAERTVQKSSTKIQRFKIHNAFHSYLGIDKAAN